METLDLYNLRIKQIIDKFGFYMLKNPNIVGVGRGYKVINGHMTNKPTLVFYVAKKLSKNSLNSCDAIPEVVKGISTDVIESGYFKSLVYSEDKYSRNNIFPKGKDNRPARGGGAIMYAEPKDKTKVHFATLTYAFTERNSKENIYFLTSEHLVTSLESKVTVPMKYSINTNEYNISWELGRIIKTSVGHYSKELKGMVYTVDAALGLVGPNKPIIREIRLCPGLLNGKLITEVQAPKLGDKVYKYGAVSKVTTGVISAVDLSTQSETTDNVQIFNENQIGVNQNSQDGDSGSLGVIESTGKAFGMLNASGGANLAIYNNIQIVMDYFKIDFLT